MIFHCLVIKMRIGNFAIRKMRNHYNRRTRFAWLLMMVYLPMLLAITFHYHTAAEGDSAAAYCSDCDHHVHHNGHLASSQGFTQECPLRGAYHCSYSSICCYGPCRLFHVLPLCQDEPRRYPIYPCSAGSPYFIVFRIFDPNLLAITILRGRLGTYPFHVL